MIKWFNNMLHILMILIIAIWSSAVIADDKSPKTSESKLQEIERKVEQGDQWLAHQVKRVLIYSKSSCEMCDQVKNELKKHNIEFQHVDLTWNRKQNMILSRKAGREDVSYVFVGNEYIGNHEDLMKLLTNGKLMHMLDGRE